MLFLQYCKVVAKYQELDAKIKKKTSQVNINKHKCKTSIIPINWTTLSA